MKKAYVIMAHKAPEQLFRLVSRLNDGRSEFFIHLDAKAEINGYQKLEQFGSILTFTKRFDAMWGGLGLIQPYLGALKHIQDSGKNFDRYLLLSGQDYPIKNNREIDAFFANETHTNFINYFPIPNYAKWPGTDRGGLYRVDKYYFGAAWYQSLQSRALNLLATYLPFLKRKIPYDMKPFAGQTWWNIDTPMRDYLLDFHQKHPKHLYFHRNTFVADELFLHMIIGNCTDKTLTDSICNRDLRFTIWEKQESAHPKILGVQDFAAIKNSADLFARKFDENMGTEILDLIDENLLQN